MSETVAVALATGSFTLAASLLAALIANAGSGRTAADARREARIERANGPLTDLATACPAWADNIGVVSMVYGVDGDRNQEIHEYFDTDSGRAVLDDAKTSRRAIADLRVLFAAERVQAALTSLETELALLGTAQSDLLRKSWRAENDPIKGIGRALAHVDRVKAAVSHVQTVAAADLHAPPTSRWRRRAPTPQGSAAAAADRSESPPA